MKILFTGMGSHHCKRPTNTSFFTLLADQVSEFAEVTWSSPDVAWTRDSLDSYDHVFFGILPPTSISANKLYGALNVFDLLFDSPKLTLVFDSPQVWQYRNSINAITRDYKILLGSYYSKREGYEKALRNSDFLASVSAKMSSTVWPRIIYPRLPWNSDNKIRSAMGFAEASELIGLNFDAKLISTGSVNFARKDVWAAENMKSSWLSYLLKSISLPVQATKQKRSTDDSSALDIIANSVGLILPPQDRNNVTWWNYRIVQALNSSTPIVTYWQDTKDFDESWSVLAYQVEDMSPAQRQHLSSLQRESYLLAIDTAADVSMKVKNIVIDSMKESD